jgi:hypothetical protein
MSIKNKRSLPLSPDAFTFLFERGSWSPADRPEQKKRATRVVRHNFPEMKEGNQSDSC